MFRTRDMMRGGNHKSRRPAGWFWTSDFWIINIWWTYNHLWESHSIHHCHCYREYWIPVRVLIFIHVQTYVCGILYMHYVCFVHSSPLSQFSPHIHVQSSYTWGYTYTAFHCIAGQIKWFSAAGRVPSLHPVLCARNYAINIFIFLSYIIYNQYWYHIIYKLAAHWSHLGFAWTLGSNSILLNSIQYIYRSKIGSMQTAGLPQSTHCSFTTLLFFSALLHACSHKIFLSLKSLNLLSII